MAAVKNIRKSLICMIMASSLLSGAAHADEPRIIAKDGYWTAYTFIEDGKKVCYMASQPQKMDNSAKKAKRGDVYALVTNRPADGTKNVFSYIAGYTYKAGSNVTVTIGKDKFTLFTQDDTAWAPDGATDNKIAAAMRKGKSMVVKGESAHGTATTDSFALKGTGAAYEAITRDCGKT
jgi:hypothetical protein